MLRLTNIKVSVKKEITKDLLLNKAVKLLKTEKDKIKSVELFRKSVDSRDKNDVIYVLSIDVELKNSNDEKKLLKLKNVSKAEYFNYTYTKKESKIRPVIVGFGPAGMLAGLVLARSGLKPVIIERGKKVDERKKDIEEFFKTGILNLSSNVQFGEGGAGTFSDGKLTTGIKDKRCRFVIDEFVNFGAPKEIKYLAKPHIGTDKLINMVKNIREEIISLGGEILFEHKLIDLVIKDNSIKEIVVKNNDNEFSIGCERLILALGHSARDTFEMLVKKPLIITEKPFSVGVRIEHKQEMINKSQYGDFAKYLPPADYKLAVHLKNGRSAYTFCMCPGGYVIAAASEKERLVTNGMSYYKRNGENANSALLIGVNPTDFKGDSPLAGIEFQREIEHKAFVAGGGGYIAPIQRVGDILRDIPSKEITSVKPTYKPNVKPTDLSLVFPDYIYESLKLGICEMDKKIKGFADDNAILTAVESRSSSPVRIERNEYLLSAVKGIYPCGEGCGYAGGIVSAAVDGVRCAEAVAQSC